MTDELVADHAADMSDAQKVGSQCIAVAFLLPTLPVQVHPGPGEPIGSTSRNGWVQVFNLTSDRNVLVTPIGGNGQPTGRPYWVPYPEDPADPGFGTGLVDVVRRVASELGLAVRDANQVWGYTVSGVEGRARNSRPVFASTRRRSAR